MKKLHTCLFLLCCFSFAVYGQEDSLKVVVAKNVEMDSTGVEPEAQQAYNDGTIAYENKNYNKAKTEFKKAIEIAPDFLQAHINLAYSYLANKEQKLAEKQFKHITTINDTVHKPFYELGTLAESKDSVKLAVDYYSKAIERYKKDKQYFYQRGIQYFKLGEYEKAIADFSEVILLDPKFADAYNDRGSAYKLSDEIDKAIADYKSATKINSDFALAYNNLGSVYREKKEYDLAIQAYDKAIFIEKDNFLAWNNRGYAKFEKEAYQDALADFQKVNSLKPDYIIAYNNIAGVYMELEDYEKVVSYSTMAIDKDENMGAAYYNRAIANEMLRNEVKACEDWNKAADLGIRIAEEYYTTNSCRDLIEE